MEVAESRATLADRRANEAMREAITSKQAAEELAQKVRFLEAENKFLR